jgi:hypothetical protein
MFYNTAFLSGFLEFVLSNYSFNLKTMAGKRAHKTHTSETKADVLKHNDSEEGCGENCTFVGVITFCCEQYSKK